MAEVPQQADADPVVVVLEWLRGHPAVADLLGGPADLHVSGIYEAPWLHLTVDDGDAADMRDLTWDGEYEVSLELSSHPNGAPGKAAMRNIAMRLLRIIADLPEQQEVSPTTPVVSRVRPSGMAVWQPMKNGQSKYAFGAMVVLRPPRVLPTQAP